MSRLLYTFEHEPRGKEYRSLIRLVGPLSAEAILVIRDDLGLDVHGQEVLQDLKGSLVAEARSSSWPGTTLIGHEALVLRFRADEGAVSVLARSAEGLYDWEQPGRPEDLCFVRSDGTAILTTIAHERDARIEIDPGEYATLVAACPWLLGMLAKIEG